MKIRDWLGFRKSQTLREILETHDLVGFAEGYPVVVDKEIGSSAVSPQSEGVLTEYNRKLEGVDGIKVYNEMRKVDATVAGTLRAIKLPILAARWFVTPADDSDEAKEVADFVEHCLFEGMSITWAQVVSEALLSLNYGFYMFEKVWSIDKAHPVTGKRQIVLKKLAPRHPADVVKFKFDDTGGPKSVVMLKKDGDYGAKEVEIPIEKMAVVTNERESGNIMGTSILRPAYRNYFFKSTFLKIDAIQKERHGIGIPVIKLPHGANEKHKQEANELGTNLRTNERAHIVLPPGWEILFAQIGGNPVDAMKSVEYHDTQIRQNVLSSFIGGDRSVKEDELNFMYKSCRLYADNVCETFNRYVIPQLVAYNFKTDLVPRLKVRRIGEQAEWRVISFALRNAIGSGVIRPDDVLEKWMREQFDLPKADVLTSRVISTPQAAPSQPATTPNVSSGKGPFGLPNQTPVAKVGQPAQQGGFDRGGQS